MHSTPALAELERDPPLEPRTAFSLVEGDLVNRVFGFFGIGLRPLHLLWRSLILAVMTWGALAVIAGVEGLSGVTVRWSRRVGSEATRVPRRTGRD